MMRLARMLVAGLLLAAVLPFAGASPPFTAALAQLGPPGPPNPEGAPFSKERIARVRERVQTMRIWKLTEALELDTEVATRFFPRYRAHMARQDSLQENLHKLLRRTAQAVRTGEGDLDGLRERVREASLERERGLFQFVDDVGDLLSEEQQAALLVFEFRFNQELRDILRDIRRERGVPAPRMPGGRRR